MIGPATEKWHFTYKYQMVRKMARPTGVESVTS